MMRFFTLTLLLFPSALWGMTNQQIKDQAFANAKKDLSRPTRHRDIKIRVFASIQEGNTDPLQRDKKEPFMLGVPIFTCWYQPDGKTLDSKTPANRVIWIPGKSNYKLTVTVHGYNKDTKQAEITSCLEKSELSWSETAREYSWLFAAGPLVQETDTFSDKGEHTYRFNDRIHKLKIKACICVRDAAYYAALADKTLQDDNQD